MAYVRASDAAIGLDVTVAAGTITRHNMLEHVRHQIADPHWPAGLVTLSDFRLVDAVTITPDDLRDAATLYEPKTRSVAQHKTAYLRSPAFRGAAVLEREFAQRYGIGPVSFDDLTSACEWLGVDETLAQRLVAGLRAELGIGAT